MAKSIKTALKNIRRTPYQALAAISVLSLTFFTVSIFTLLSAGIHLIFLHFETAPQVIAFFEKGQDLGQVEIDQIHQKLAATGKLSSFKYVSTKDAEAIYKEKNKNDPLLNELVDYKILPPSIEISATQIGALTELKDILEKEPLVQDLAFYEDVVNQFSLWLNNLRLLGTAIIGFLLFMSLLILVLVIGLKIKHKRTEIQILRLLGASGWYIHAPFLMEGMLYGIFGAFFGWLAAFTVLQYSTPYLINWLDDILVLPVDPWLLLAFLGILSLLGMIIGMFGSILAVRRFIKI